MAQPVDRETFKDYCFRRLGWPLIPIAVDNQQAEDRIDDALSFYRDWHHDATEHLFYSHQLTSQDIANKYITVPERVIGISRILPTGLGNGAWNFMNPMWQMTADAMMAASSGGSLVSYSQAMANIAELEFLMSSTPSIRFNRNSNKIYVQWDWGSKNVGEWVAFEGVGYLEEQDYVDIWRDRWLMEYTTMMIKRQHGENLKLTGGVQLLGGITINGDAIFQEADARLKEMEDQLMHNMSFPPLDAIG